MTAVHSKFTTVTVHSDPTKHNGAAKRSETPTPAKSQKAAPASPWEQWMSNVTDAARRRRNRLNARAELIALGVDPDRFLEYHRVQVGETDDS